MPATLAPALLETVVRRGHARGEPWTGLMHEVARQLFALGHTRADLEGALRSLPYFPEMPRAFAAGAAVGARSYVLSDSNTVYIDVLLRHMGLGAAMSGIVTNGAEWDAAGRLHISPRTPPSAPHGCARCPPNLCKGAELTVMAAAHWAAGARVLYVGDGGGDVCACLRLAPGDVVAARAGRGFALLPALTSPPLAAHVRARVRAWSDGAALLNIVTQFLAEGEGPEGASAARGGRAWRRSSAVVSLLSS